jgi:hypothetical protein
MTGTLDDGPDALPPKGEVSTKEKNKFMPQMSGMWIRLKDAGFSDMSWANGSKDISQTQSAG